MQEPEAPPVEDAPKNLYAKLAEVMSEIGYVEKRGYNSFHKYKYVTEADLVDAVRSKLASRNVALIPSVTRVDTRPTQGGKPSTVTTVHMAFTFCDGDTGQTHVAEWAGAGDDPADKGLYKAYTGAVKYFLMKSFLIPTGDDPEADAGTDERASAAQARPVPRGVDRSTGEVKEPGPSDVPAPDIWVEEMGELIAQLKMKGPEIRHGLESVGVEVPVHISAWGRVLGGLAPQQRNMFRSWLLEQASDGTPIA